MPSLGDLDRQLLVFARTRGHWPGLERALSAYSRCGEHGGCWLALGAVGATVDRRPRASALWRRGVRVVAAGYALNYAVKLAVRRRRPDLPGMPPLTPTVSRLSFPSAHSTTSFAAARAFGAVAPAPALYTAAVLFGLSRPYLGVHFPSDVLAGALLGSGLATVWPRPKRGAGRCR